MATANNRNFLAAQFDAATELKDAGAVTANGAATVGGVARVVNVGTGFLEAVLVVDVDVIDTTSTDEGYTITLQGSTVADFSTDVVTCSTVVAGKASATGESADRGSGRIQRPFINSPDGAKAYPYLRVFIKVSGTTPSVNFRAFITKSNLR